jgi:N-acetylmuramoyl-L-alanine amidase
MALVLAVAPTAGHATVGPSPEAVGTDLIAVRFGGDSVSTRVVLDLSGAARGEVIRGEGGADHLILRLPSLRARQPMTGHGRGLVGAWSLSTDGQGARLDLSVPIGAKPARRFLIPPPPEGGPWRYVIDIDDPDPLSALAAEFPAHASTSAPASVVAVASSGAAVGPRPVAAARSLTPPPVALLPVSTAGSSAPMIPPPAVRPAVETISTPRAPPPRVVARASLARSAPSRRLKVIVVDAGHGGHDPGAKSLVRNEKDITLAAALSLKAHLEQFGRYRVVLTRDSDVFIPLEARVQIARRAGADLFISLHADSAGSDPTPHGASVYTLSDHGQTRVKTVLGPHEWFTHFGAVSTEPAIGRILLDLTQRSTLNRSSQFASLLVDHIAGQVDLLPRTHRDASYFVLLAPDVPAVLLEMGFITNPADEMRLTDPAQRDLLMASVADTIDDFFQEDARLSAG